MHCEPRFVLSAAHEVPDPFRQGLSPHKATQTDPQPLPVHGQVDLACHKRFRKDISICMKTRKIIFIFLVWGIFLSGCHRGPILMENIPKIPQPEQADYSKPLPPGELALRKITDPAEIPDFTDACHDLANLKNSISNSLNYLKKPSSRRHYPYGKISHQQVVESLEAFRDMINAGYGEAELNSLIRERFDVYTSVGCDDRGTVLFTGYYTPEFEGSRHADERFKYPLYSQPDDLVKDDEGNTLGRRTVDGLVPYPSRGEMENAGMLKGKEIMWLADPFEVYLVQVQGSAKIRQPDGSRVGIAYAASNGHEYRSIGQLMIRDSKIAKERVSLSTIRDYFRSNPEELPHYINQNPRFIFFRMEDGEPRGSINEPVIALRSIATDKSVYPRAALAFLDTVLPKAQGDNVVQALYTGFALDQDTGGAIRAPGRCDVYMGEGETAGRLAGQAYREGRLYYLFLKSEY